MTEDLRPFGDPSSESFRVDAYPFYLLNRTASRYNILIEAQLRTLGIDIPTWRVLMILGEYDRLAIAQVAKLAVINLSTMIRVVERMENAALVVVRASSSDRRVKELVLTETGKAKLAAARDSTAPMFKRIIKGFTASEFRKLLDMLNRLFDNLEPE